MEQQLPVGEVAGISSCLWERWLVTECSVDVWTLAIVTEWTILAKLIKCNYIKCRFSSIRHAIGWCYRIDYGKQEDHLPLYCICQIGVRSGIQCATVQATVPCESIRPP